MTTLDSEWETSSGLPLDGATVEVTAMEFGYNANIGAGVVCANFTFTFIEGDNEGEEAEQSFSVGSNGEPSRDGSELIGAPTKLPSRTNYGRLIDSVRALVDHPGEVIGSPKSAEGWIGTRWTLGTVPVETQNPNTKETKTKDAFVFTAFHGKGKKAGAKKSAAATTKKTAAKNAPEPDEDEGGAEAETETTNAAGISDAMWKKLVKMAKAADSHDEFSDEALELPGVDADKKIQKAILSVKPGSVWHEVHGDE